MKFYQETITGDLILIKTNIPTAPPHPIWAQSAKPPWVIRLALCLIALFAPLISHWPPPIWAASKARVTVLAILAMVLVELLAQSHVEKVLEKVFGLM